MVRLISLGSSFAAGPGILPQVDTDAARSSNNYPNYFARHLGLDPTDPDQFLDLSVSSATLLNLVSEPQDTGRKTFPPQLSLLPPLEEGDDGSDVIVTVTGGGNDMFYIGSMFSYTLQHTWWGKVLWYLALDKEKRDVLSNPPIASPDEISNRFTALLDGIRERYPKATIYLMEYHAMCGQDTKGGIDVAWPQYQVTRYIEQANLLQSLYAKAAKGRSNVHLVPLASTSLAHALGSKQPWVSDGSMYNFYTGGAYHPNHLGMQQAATILFDYHTSLSKSSQ